MRRRRRLPRARATGRHVEADGQRNAGDDLQAVIPIFRSADDTCRQEPSREPEPAPEPIAQAEPPSRNGDEAGARLIALNMALSGTPREETAAYLAEHYDLADADALLDDVYSQVGQ